PDGWHHQECAHAGVGEQARIDQAGELVLVTSRLELRNIADQRGADSEIEDAVIPGQGKNQDPQAKSFVAKMMQDERRQEEADRYVDGKAAPARNNVLQGAAGQAHGRAVRSAEAGSKSG